MSLSQSPPLLDFPCDFPLKVLIHEGEATVHAVSAIIMRHAPDFNPEAITRRPSRGGKYVGLTCMVHARSQAQLDAIYQELVAHPEVKAVL